MLRRLYIIRHGKSSWDHPGLEDIDRPLANRGIRNAGDMAGRLQQAGLIPQLIYSSPASRALNTAMLMSKSWDLKPEQLLYAKTHEWVDVQADTSGAKIATVGLSAFALHALTDLVYVELPEVGREVEAGAAFGEVESVKAVSDLYAPVDGEIVEVNSGVVDRLDRLGDDPYEAGWLVKIRITDESGLSELLDYPAYQRQCDEELADE